MGEALTDFSGVDTTVAIRYAEGSASEPGSLLFGIDFTKDYRFQPSFSKTAEFGDFGTPGVEESLLVIDGFFSISNEFGVIFESDNDEELLLFASLADDDCATFPPAPNNQLEFNIAWRKDGDESSTTTPISINSCDSSDDSEGVDGRVGNVRSALDDTELGGDVTVSLIGGECDAGMYMDIFLHQYLSISSHIYLSIPR